MTGAVASNTLACLGVPFGQTVSKRDAPVCAEYQLEAVSPSPGVSLRSIETTAAESQAGKGFAFALSYTDQEAFFRTRFEVCDAENESAQT